MKTIKKKFKFHSFTYFLVLLACCSGFFKNISLILIIILFHELGHILAIKHYEYEIEKVEIYPFGGITKVNKPINTPLKQEIIIAFAGVFFQLFLQFAFSLFYKYNFILENTYYLFKSYNQIILIFNLLPIIPLDGSVIFHSILEYVFPYQKAYKLFLSFSIVFFLLFLYTHTLHSLNNYMILTFLLFKIYDAYKKQKYYQNKFYLERHLYEIPYTKIKSHSNIDLRKLKKDTLHFFWQQDRYRHEKEILKNYYTK